MANYKVVWKDGMFVLPQHFQQMEQYLTSNQSVVMHQLNPLGHGLSSFQINSAVLSSGVFQLENAEGIFSDGTPFSLQIAEELPVPRKIDDFIVNQELPLMVYLAIPSYWSGSSVYTDTSTARIGRFKKHTIPITDDATGVSQEDIEVAQHNISFLFEGESHEGYVTLPIAKVRKLVTGATEIVESYVPPLLAISASQPLLNLVRSAISSLRIHGSELMRARKEMSASLATFAPEEITSLTILQSISTFVPLLEQYIGMPKDVSPFMVNSVFAQLVGSLAVFKPGNEIISLPRYAHDDIYAIFTHYKEVIDSLITSEHSPNSMVIDMNKTGQVTYQCPFDDSVDLEGTKLFLGVTADANPADLNRAVVGLLKLSSNDLLPRLTMSAMPGLAITAVHNPSKMLPTKEGYIYFVLEQDGEHWQSILAEKSMAIYFPGNFQNLSMQLIVMKSED